MRRYWLAGLMALAVLGAGSGARLRAQARTVNDGVYADDQAARGMTLYAAKCVSCHGEKLEGGTAPPLAGSDFESGWAGITLGLLVDKIEGTMPAGGSASLTRDETVDLVAYMLQVGKFPSGSVPLPSDAAALGAITIAARSASAARPMPPVASHAPSFPPAGNLAEVMRGILFPSSNLIFNVQTNDPGAPVKPGSVGAGATTSFSWVDWGAGIYKGWEIVDYAAVAIAESAPLMLTPGRRCENGKLVPVDRPDWIRFSQEMAEAGRAAYRAAQTRKQEAVSEASNQLADSCLHCHEIYRDKPGGTKADPSNKAARCVP